MDIFNYGLFNIDVILNKHSYSAIVAIHLALERKLKLPTQRLVTIRGEQYHHPPGARL